MKAKVKSKIKSHWNHRVMAHEQPDGSVYFQVHEVFYKNEVPDSYTSNPITIGGEDVKSLKWTVQKIYDTVLILGSQIPKNKILWAGKKFPLAYEPKTVTKPKSSKRHETKIL